MGYALPPKNRPAHLHGDTFALLDLEDTVAGRKAFVRRLDEIAAAEAERETVPSDSPQRRSFSDLFERGWVHGSDTFRDIVLEAFGPAETKEPSASANSNYRSSELGKAFSEAEAGRILADGLKHFDLDEASRQKTAKGDWLARTISERTTVRQEWIAERLSLKSASNVSQRVRQYRMRPDRGKSKRERKWEKMWLNSKFLD